jgi:putative heme-binding domain-containing protein
MFKAEKGVPQRLRALWALEAIGKLTDEAVSALFGDHDEVVRAWGYRLASPARGASQLLMGSHIPMEQSPYVLAAAASALQFHIQAYTVYEPLARHKLVKDDPRLSLLLWYGVESWYSRSPESAFISLPGMESQLVRQNTVRYVLAQPKWAENLAKLMKVLADASDDVVRFDILHGIREALAGRKNAVAPTQWADVYANFRKADSLQLKREAEAVAVLFGDKDAIAELLKRITDTSARAEDRRAAVELLAPRRLPDFAKTLQRLLEDSALRGTAIRALAGFPDANTPVAILKAYPAFTSSEKADAVQTLAARTSFAKALLDAVEKGTVPRADVPVTAARQILALNDKTTAARLEQVWGKITPVAKERAALIKKWKGILTEDSLKAADVVNGRALFTKHCAACHKMFGEGQAVGPELTGSQRANLDYVLENVLDPSAVVPREYQLINFTLADERVVGGIVLRETKDAVTVRTVNDTITIPTADITTRKQTPLSLMPEGLFDAMKPEEVRDLVAYLRVKEQVPKR